MTPYAAQPPSAAVDPDLVDAGERSTRPAFEARLRTRWGDNAAASGATVSGGLIGSYGGEIGVGMHRGWVASTPGELEESHAVSVDGRFVIAPNIELRGEGYAGRLLRGLGGGAIGQNYGAPPVGAPAGATGAPIRDVAGWLQINGQPVQPLIMGVGCGIDVANADDNPTRFQNTVCAAHADWRPIQPLLFGIEYRQFGTRFSSGIVSAHHINFIFGFEL
jgi:hypothetical protein